MPAAVETMFSVRDVPWHGEGYVPKRPPKSIDEALIWSGLNWQVEQVPVQVRVAGKMHKDPNVVANVRVRKGANEDGSDEVTFLGVVTKKYKPVQNREAFSFLSNLYGTDMMFESAGSLLGGKRVWVLMKLPEWIEVAGDPYVPYAFVSNSHDGKSSVLSACTPIKIVCRNTELAAIRGAKRVYTLRHMGDMQAKIHEAREVLGITIDYYQQFKAVGDQLGAIKLTDRRAQNMLETILPYDESRGDRAAENVDKARQVVMSLFKEGFHPSLTYGADTGPTDTRGNAAGSYMGFYNAVTEYADWGRTAYKSRWKRAVDDSDGLKARAFAVVLSKSGVTV
jgi:phage/plasmid-like protein (TIGR03299 family)